jgi:hypothetical protein
LAGKAEPGQVAHEIHQANRDRGSEMQTWMQFRAVEKKQPRVQSLPVRLLEAVLEIAF